MEAEGMGQFRLGLAHFRQTQVVEAQIGRQMGLVVAGVERPCPGDVSPFRESLAPPLIILRYRMILGKVEGDGFG